MESMYRGPPISFDELEESDHEMESAKYRKCLGRDKSLNKRPVNVNFRYAALNQIDTVSPTCTDNSAAGLH